MKGYERLFARYLGTGAAYGLARSIYWTYGARIKEYNFNTHQDMHRPMLVAEKIPVCVISTLVSSVYWPFYVMRDAYDMELNVRGLTKDFNNNRSNKIFRSAYEIVYG